MKKIIFYNDAVEFGGHELMSANIANILSTKYDVVFLYYNENYNYKLKKSIKKIKLELRNSYKSFHGISFRDVKCIRKIYISEKPDLIIHCQGDWGMGLKSVFAAKKLKTKTVTYIAQCTFMFSKNPFNVKNYLKKFVIKLNNLTETFITVTDIQKSIAKKLLSKDKKIYVVENLLDANLDSIRKIERADKFFNIGIVGRIIKEKGHFFTLNIAEKLLNIRNDFKFILIGKGPHEELLKSEIKNRNLENYFQISAYLNSKEEIYSDLDIVFIPSELESLSLVMIEALFFKIPVLARISENTAIFKQYLNNRFLFKTVDDAVKILSDIEKFISDFQKVSDNLKQLVKDRNGIEIFKKTVFILFDKLI